MARGPCFLGVKELLGSGPRDHSRHGLAAQTRTWNQPPEFLVPDVSASAWPWARSRNTVTFPGEFGSHGSRAAAVPSCSRWSSLATHRITPSPVRTSGAGEAREAGADEATRGAARCARGGEARVLHPPDAGRETSPVHEEHGKEGLTAAELMREMEDEPFFKHRHREVGLPWRSHPVSHPTLGVAGDLPGHRPKSSAVQSLPFRSPE
ncbi:uncharacterized protein LOC112864389 [Puma concolor]|uniref:Uncharacterized protein LOC112864389 n=1 Tax=Puma concolor TaxID=9696 RepID=A0A6P6I509_PUMCO|nr:uncharacterized protein LOC112864389 [Puma concolor]